MAPRVEIRTITVLSVPIRLRMSPTVDGGDGPALLEQSAIGAPRPAAALSRRARTCHDAGRKGRHDRGDFSKKIAPTCRRSRLSSWSRRRVNAKLHSIVGLGRHRKFECDWEQART